MFKCADENEESSLLQTIRIPKNLLFLPDTNFHALPKNLNWGKPR